MRLLQVNLRGSLAFSLILVLVSIPVSLLSIRALLNEEVDESIAAQAEQFIYHVKGFEYLDDLETDLQVLDKLSSNIHIQPSDGPIRENYRTLYLYDSIDHEEKPFRRFEKSILIKGKAYKLVVRMSLVENNDLIMTIGLVQLAVSFLLAAGLLLLNRSLSRRLWKPFYKTLDHLKAYELDKNQSMSKEKSKITEFNDLNTAVIHLVDRNREIYLQQKEFIENASHELQTPIAIFQSKLDSLMQSPTLTQSEADTIMELELTTQRMARLNKNLLLLSKIDNDQFMDKEDIDISALINGQRDFLVDMAEPGGLKIESYLEKLTIHVNRALIEVLLSNLFNNAIRHSTKEGVITIVISNRTVSISNPGQGRAVDMNRMTQRFSKDSRDSSSTGLGLAIVKKICDSAHFNLAYEFRNSIHTFSITF
ncbi:MAG TPA: HAMP domain-containing sensor histidine kinase [Cyclobacteriaceae bacterium]|nr:HAMP domain-containing sensor histidine kinase [Cyclobacteriaceae bacterium]